MDPLHATLHKASRSVVLDPHVKAGFRRTLQAMTEPTGIPQEASFRVPRALAWALAAVIAATTGAGVTYASSKAVPGDALYAIKVNALEPAESALAFSADAKAEVAVTHLERRFREAAELAANGTLEEHDEQLARLAARDVATVDRDDQPVARARFEALSATYGSSVIRGKARFAAAVRIGDPDDAVSDDLALATAKQQLAIAQDKRDKTVTSSRIPAIEKRIEASARLSAAANQQLANGSFQAAMELSGAAAKIATEAQLFSTFASSTPETATTTTSTVAASSTVTASTTASTTPADGSGKDKDEKKDSDEDSFFKKVFR